MFYMELKKVKNKNQETDGYGRDKRPKTEKLKRKEITMASLPNCTTVKTVRNHPRLFGNY